MALDNIAVTVREGDSFDELYLNIEKPWGTPHDITSSVLVADIRRFFNDNATPTSAVDSFGIVELNPSKGEIALKLTSRQTEALGRNIPLGYTERGVEQTGLALSTDPTDEQQGKFLWDLREYFSLNQATITSISSGTTFTTAGGVTANKVRITTSSAHNLTVEDQIILSGTGQNVYDGVDFNANKLSIISSNVFEIEPTTAGAPAFSVGSIQGTVSVYKEDTLAIGTLEVLPRISRDSVS
tara:strand:+ start:1011 stop:1733 length:723 start_codon:yes stop_codon:yes gene_type:complete